MFNDLQPGKHLLFDKAVIADTYRLKRSVHRPRVDAGEPVMRAEHPWEGSCFQPARVEHDAATGQWTMWYRGVDESLAAQRKALGNSPYGNVGAPQPEYICYATSKDGLRWDRPALGVHDHPSGDNNICFAGHSGAFGCILNRPGSPHHRRYLLSNLDWFHNGYGGGGVCLADSDDGIHWQYLPNQPIIHGESDTFNCIAWNEQRQVYMLYMRAWHSAAQDWIKGWVGGPGFETGPLKNARRRIAYSESTDLKTWSEPKIIMTPDELDSDDFYGMTVFPYADAYIGELWVYDDNGGETIHTELAFSRDGVNWMRLPDRPRFLGVDEEDPSGGKMVFPIQQPVEVGDDLYVYWSSWPWPHDRSGAGDVAHRGKLRKDGFVSLDADRRLGALITQPFTLQSSHIEINASTCRGRIVAELTEPWNYEPRGKVIDGFTADDFDVFEGDSVRHRLSWRGKSDLSSLRGRRVMLRMSLCHAKIFSVTL